MKPSGPKTKGLGRGLGAIFEIEERELPQKKSSSAMFHELEVGSIIPNPAQPRKHFDPEALQELADSIRSLGVIQPITVKHTEDDRYIIISGERRWRAAQVAGVESLPAYVREVDDQTLMEMALVENIQRQDLNAIEVAFSLQRLIEECGLTQEKLGERIGKNRSTVANYMRLLKLPAEVQLALREELITMGHARTLITIEDPAQQLTLLKRIVKKGLSVRAAEELVKQWQKRADQPEGTTAEEEFPPIYTQLVEQLEGLFTQEISIRKNSRGGGGKITIGFSSDEEVARILQQLESRSNS